jgi:hypothetical protein
MYTREQMGQQSHNLSLMQLTGWMSIRMAANYPIVSEKRLIG